MNRRVILTDVAEAELEAAYRWYVEHALGLRNAGTTASSISWSHSRMIPSDSRSLPSLAT